MYNKIRYIAQRVTQDAPSRRPMLLTVKATIHATAHCPTATPAAHLPPSSRFTDATAATQGVYSRQNTSRLRAERGVIAVEILAALPYSTVKVETTLSFAIKPDMRAVEARQSAKPRGANIGAITPATSASMLL